MDPQELLHSDDKYVCTLSPELKKIAFEELREDENTRAQSIEQMREWIRKHPNIKRCRTDSNFLLRFLRTKKFSVPQACEMLERYLTIRQLYPQWFQKLDIEDKDMQAIIDSGYIYPLIERDEEGRQVIISCAGGFDPYKYTSVQMARVHGIITETLMENDINQVVGYNYVNDESGLQLGHISLWSLSDVRNMVRCIQNSCPMRHKATHFVNITPTGIKFIEFAMNFLSEKLKKRVLLHKSVDELKKKINPNILPTEYGGKVPISDMVKEFKKLAREKRDILLALDDMYIEINPKECPLVSEMNEELGMGLEGSFRKLVVD